MADVFFRAPLSILFLAFLLAQKYPESYNFAADQFSSIPRVYPGSNFLSNYHIRVGLVGVYELTKRTAFVCNSRTNSTLSTTTVISLLLLCGDIQLNPGPPRFPCGICGKSVKINQRGIQCDSCDVWHHIRCMNIRPIIYEALANSSCIWECNNCGLPNFSSSLLESLACFTSKDDNQFSALVDISTSSSIGSPKLTSSPTPATLTTNKSPRASSRKLRLLNVNCQSVCKKKELLQALIDSTKPDIVIGTESWLKPTVLDSEIFPSNFSAYRKDRLPTLGGGVFTLVSDQLVSERIENLETDPEMLWIKISISGSKDLYLCSYYRPDVSDAVSLDNLSTSLGYICNKNCHIWLTGDFNFPGITWPDRIIKPNCPYPSLHEQFLTVLDDNCLTQLIDKPTRLENTLDLFITNNPTLILSTEVIPGLADHEAVVIEGDISALTNRQKPRTISMYNKADWAGFRSYMGKFYHHYSGPGDNAEQLWDAFTCYLKKGIKNFIPSKLARHKNNLPWINQDIKRLIRRRDKLYRIKNITHLSRDTKRYRSVKRAVQKEIRRAYWAYLNNIFEDLDSDKKQGGVSKRFWSFIKHARTDKVGISTMKSGDRVLTDPRAKADLLNTYFKSTFSTPEHSQAPSIPGVPTAPQMPSINITAEGVRKLLSLLNPHKAAGPDGLHPRVLRELCVEIAPILCDIFRASLFSGLVPPTWKQAYVTPVFKKGSKDLPENYRPISLTCLCSKIFEHVLVSNISHHLELNNLLNEFQHGFRKYHSCETQLIGFIDDLACEMQGGGQSDVIVLDFSKAFDKVPHAELILKLKSLGIDAHVVNWIQDFLKDRHQCVVLEGEKSSPISVTSGVPQGSVLGPTLFLAFINDLPHCIKSRVRLFADDTAVYLAINSVDDCAQLQQDLLNLEAWEQTWSMEFNVTKCNILRITRRRYPTIYNYHLHGKPLEALESVKYLGVHISTDLRWNEHVRNITNKANKSLGFLKRNLRHCSRITKERAYTSLVRPQLEYCSTAWDPYTIKNITKVEMVQRRAARWVLGCYGRTDSVTNMLNELGWYTLQQRRAIARLSLIYKFHNGLAYTDSDMLIPVPYTATRASGHSFLLPKIIRDYYKYSFFPRSLKDWNNLPPKIALSPTLALFKASVADLIRV